MFKVNQLFEAWMWEKHAWFMISCTVMVIIFWIALIVGLVLLITGVPYWWKVLVADGVFFVLMRGCITFGFSWYKDTFLGK